MDFNNNTFSYTTSNFTEEDYRLCVELLKTLEFSMLPLKAIIITTLIPTDQAKRYDIETDGTYFLFGKEAWGNIVRQLRVRAGSFNTYSLYVDVPIIESDEKASEVLAKYNDSVFLSRYNFYTRYLASVSKIPYKFFTGS